jgi:DNA (cytosine-5)-methyltransferase 1
MKVGSLFAGIGGFDLGLERAGFEITWQVEIDPYCQRVLAKHWPHVQRYGDIRAIDWATVPRVDLLCGGFPCQDLSFAGKRAGIDGERSGLWSEYVRAIRALRPRYILVENVPGLLTNEYMGRVLGDLAACGYDAEWSVLSACAMGAPHTRERVFILAYAESCAAEECSMELSQGLQGQPGGMGGAISTGNSWAIHQPGLVGVATRIPDRMDRCEAIGNAIVPQIAEWLGRQIMRSA